MSNHLASIVAQYGLLIVFGNVFAEQIGFPIPAIPTLVVAGGLAAAGKISLIAVFLVAMVASMAADITWYFAGRHYGNRVMRALCMISLTPDSCVIQTQERFESWCVKALLVA